MNQLACFYLYLFSSFAIHEKTDSQDCFKLLMVLHVILAKTDSFPTPLKKLWVLKGIIAYRILEP